MASRTLFNASSAALLLSSLTAVGCSGSDSTRTPQKSADVTLAKSSVVQTPPSAVPASALSAAVAANNAFGVDLYAHVLEQPATNVLTSPISASLALTMTYAGAKGDTKTEMATALHLDPVAGDAAFAGQNALSQALNARAAAALSNAKRGASPDAQPSETDYQLQVVNSVWGEKTYTWEPPFLDILAANYGTGVYQEDFVHASESARLTINDWVDTHTNDKIKDLLPSGSVGPTTRMVLVNAIHLKLPWDAAFKPEQTSPGDFVRPDSSKVQTSFMNQTSNFPYVDDGQAQVVSLPLSNRELSIVIALPHADVTLTEYEATLTAHSAALALPSAFSLVSLSLPKTTFTSDSFSLSSALQEMGIKQAFDPNLADFTGICAHPPDGDNLYVGDVLQKAMISMQEEGVEAAAATAVALVGSAGIVPTTPVPMNVNRPYLVAIIDNLTGTLLMLGHIQDPSDAGSP
jgi:serpin B